MLTHKKKLLVWLIALGTVMACIPSLATPISVPDSNAINTFIAQTAKAAATQTAASLPSSTPTATLTPTPRNTSTPTPTATSTIIFILRSPTVPAIPTLTSSSSGGGVSNGTSSDNYACKLVSVNPANGTSFSPRTDFDATWRVTNIGQRVWDRNSVDYVYVSGSKIHRVSGYDLTQNVKVGATVNLVAAMEAPKDPGTYSTTWALKVGSKTFCNMSLTIVVQ